MRGDATNSLRKTMRGQRSERTTRDVGSGDNDCSDATLIAMVMLTAVTVTVVTTTAIATVVAATATAAEKTTIN